MWVLNHSNFWPQNPEKGLIFESSHFRGLVTFCTHLIFSAENLCLNSKNYIIPPTILALIVNNIERAILNEWSNCAKKGAHE
jgi:hypothetical protein